MCDAHLTERAHRSTGVLLHHPSTASAQVSRERPALLGGEQLQHERLLVEVERVEDERLLATTECELGVLAVALAVFRADALHQALGHAMRHRCGVACLGEMCELHRFRWMIVEVVPESVFRVAFAFDVAVAIDIADVHIGVFVLLIGRQFLDDYFGFLVIQTWG